MQLAARSVATIVSILIRAAATVDAIAEVISSPLRTSAMRDARRGHSGDEGSIGEWVMILVMAVGIVLFIWSVAQPLLGSVLRSALSKLFR